MQIRYSKPNDLDISGTAEELFSFKENILLLPKLDSKSFATEAETGFNPFPYQSILNRIVVNQSTGAVKVSIINESEVLIEGSQQNLEALASFFDFPLDTTSGDHSHYEYFEGNEYIASDSVPLVISVK